MVSNNVFIVDAITANEKKLDNLYQQTSRKEQYSVTIEVVMPGELRGLLGNYARVITKLTLKGTLDNNDFDVLKEMGNQSLTVLDMMKVNIDKIPNEAFKDCKKLTTIVLPNKVTNIGEDAFSGCEGLISVDMSNSVTEINSGAFRSCKSLISIALSNSLTSIGTSSFSGCENITSITIPNDVVEIGEYAFINSKSLTSITIPSGVTKIGYAAFKDCWSLKEIEVDTNNQYYLSKDGVLFNKNKTILYVYPAGKKESKYSIPNSVTEIEWDAFNNCINLTSIIIPEAVKVIGGDAFNGCKSLISITIPNGVAKIGDAVFGNCESLISAVIPNSVTEIGGFAFGNCISLTSITIPKNVTKIGYAAFRNCTSLSSIIIPNGVTEIIESTFDNCTSLISITIPNNVTTVGDFAFYDCKGLISVTIPNSVAKINYGAFLGCKSLTTVTCEAVEPPSLVVAFPNNLTTSRLYVPKGSLEKYISSPWDNYFQNNIYEIGSSVSNEEITTAPKLTVYTTPDGIQIQSNEATSIAVFSISGKLIMQKQVVGTEQIDVPQGVYIINADGYNQKVLVK